MQYVSRLEIVAYAYCLSPRASCAVLLKPRTPRGSATNTRLTVICSYDDEFRIPLLQLVDHGKKIFCANWTDQDGAGRPLPELRYFVPTYPARAVQEDAPC